MRESPILQLHDLQRLNRPRQIRPMRAGPVSMFTTLIIFRGCITVSPTTVGLTLDQHPDRASGPGHVEAVDSWLRLKIAASREKCRQPTKRTAGSIGENHRRRIWIARNFKDEFMGPSSIELERFCAPSGSACEIPSRTVSQFTCTFQHFHGWLFLEGKATRKFGLRRKAIVKPLWPIGLLTPA
jgi:hypothetical protein